MATWARVSNVEVREITNTDPAGRFISDITWISVVPGNVFGGDPAAVSPRWSYTNNIFYPPQGGNAVVYVQSGAQLSNIVSFTGNAFVNAGTGQIDDSCWYPLATVNVSSTNATAHFVSYSSHIFDLALNIPPPGAGVVYISSPINNSYDGRDYVGGAEATSEHNGASDPGGNSGGGNSGGGGGTGGGGCFIASTPVLMIDGSTKPISNILPGDILQGDQGPVTVLSVHNRTNNYAMVDFNGLGYWITAEQAMLTDQGWGAFDVALLQQLEPLTYQQLVIQNNGKPLVTISEGMTLATWKNHNMVFEQVIGNVNYATIPVEVWWLRVSNDEHFIANGIVVHNAK
jgi:hypothetical protein